MTGGLFTRRGAFQTVGYFYSVRSPEGIFTRGRLFTREGGGTFGFVTRDVSYANTDIVPVFCMTASPYLPQHKGS